MSSQKPASTERSERSLKTAWDAFHSGKPAHETDTIPASTREFLKSVPHDAPERIPRLEAENQKLMSNMVKAMAFVLTGVGIGTLFGTAIYYYSKSVYVGLLVGASLVAIAMLTRSAASEIELH